MTEHEFPENEQDDDQPTLSRDEVFDEPPTVPAHEDVLPDDLDIDEALQSVSALSDAIAEQETIERRASEASAARADLATLKATQAAEPPDEPVTDPAFDEPVAMPMPPLIELYRGQTASVVPALLLIIVGAGLTFVFSTAEADIVMVSPLLVAGVLAGVVILSLFAQWLGTGRWSRGSFFVAVFVTLMGAALYYDIMNQAGMRYGSPLTLAAFGAALTLTGILSRPVERRLFMPGLLLIFGGIVALALTQGAIAPDLATQLTHWSPLVIAILAVIWLLPLIVRRRD